MTFGGFIPSTLIDYPGHVAAMVFTIGCNFRCPYCHNPELVDETVTETYSAEEILAFLKKRVGMLDGIVITGGEPTMHEELLSFLEKVKRLDFKVKLDTNGTNPDFLERAYDRKLLDYVAMDVKAPRSRYHEIVGRPVDTEAIQRSMQLLRESTVPYEFRTTLIKALLSPEDVQSIAQELDETDTYYLQKFIPTKILNPQFKRKVSYSEEEYEALLDKVRPYVKTCALR